MKPRNGFVVCYPMERSSTQVGAIIVPAGQELYVEALVVAVPENTQSTQDLRVGQIVWVEYKRKVRTPQGDGHQIVGIPFQSGDKKYLIFEESQILGIIAETIEAYATMKQATNQAATAEKLLANAGLVN